MGVCRAVVCGMASIAECAAFETLAQLLDVRASCADSATLGDHLGMAIVWEPFCAFWFSVSLGFLSLWVTNNHKVCV